MTQIEALVILHRIQRRLLAIDQKINILTCEGKNKMLDPTVTNVITAIDTATNAIGARIQALVDAQATAGALSPEAQAAFQVEIDKLNALGSDGTPASVTAA